VRTCSTTVRTSRSVRRKSRLPTNTSPLVDPAPAANKPHLRIPCIRCPRSGAAAGGVTRLRTLFGAQEYSAYRHENLDSNDRIPRCFRSIAHLPDRRRLVPTALQQAYQQTRTATSGCLAVNTDKDDQMPGTRRTRRGVPCGSGQDGLKTPPRNRKRVCCQFFVRVKRSRRERGRRRLETICARCWPD
jgi:hypothetical protein